MHVLLFGGTGYAGRAIGSVLVHAGYRVSIPCRSLPTEQIANATYTEGIDILQPKTFRYLSGVSPEVVINAAGRVTYDKIDPVNDAAVRYLVTLMRDMSTVRHFVHLSTAATLGYGSGTVTEETRMPLPERFFYATSKYRGEQEALKCPIPTTILLPPLILSPDERNTLPRLKRLAAVSWLPVPPGSNSILHPNDLADCTLRCLQKRATGRYLVTSDHISFAHMLALLGDGHERTVLPASFLQGLSLSMRLIGRSDELLAGAFAARKIDASKAWMKLGYIPRYSAAACLSGEHSTLQR